MKATPFIRAKYITAQELVERILEAISEDPQRLDMSWWIFLFKGKDKANSVYRTRNKPACGTVACFAGWGAVLLGHEDSSPNYLMNRLLGTKLSIYSSTLDTGDLFKNNLASKPGTPEQVQEVTERTRRYMKEHPEVGKRIIRVKEAVVVDPESVSLRWRKAHGVA